MADVDRELDDLYRQLNSLGSSPKKVKTVSNKSTKKIKVSTSKLKKNKVAKPIDAGYTYGKIMDLGEGSRPSVKDSTVTLREYINDLKEVNLDEVVKEKPQKRVGAAIKHQFTIIDDSEGIEAPVLNREQLKRTKQLFVNQGKKKKPEEKTFERDRVFV